MEIASPPSDLPWSGKGHLPTNERETDPQFEQKLLNVLDKLPFQIPFASLVVDFEEVEYVRIF